MSRKEEPPIMEETKTEHKLHIHPLVLVIVFLFLLMVVSMVGLYTSLRDKTRPKSNSNVPAMPSSNGAR
jgi:hypothetical protein